MKKKMLLFVVLAYSSSLFSPTKDADDQQVQYVYYHPPKDLVNGIDYRTALANAMDFKRDCKYISGSSGTMRMFMVAPNGLIRDCNQKEKDVHKNQADLSQIRGAL
ncbi:hypothetical protein [Alphaproteobacteria bacterium endosymbiont of Tiliacea citrago]|uniref:hypothetical protein n=1 Tax=Alphaproteobacteria bacterium endosymbiont of Tiliacea citrago TaxID=3077944 RepID=UPI00313A96D5